jgi:tetratricopeptide (TPR) repeat protein
VNDALDLASSSVGVLRTELSLVRDHLDAVEISLAEKSKPWYRTPSTVISITALFLSALTTVYSLVRDNRIQRSEQTQKSIEELQQLTVNLIDTRETMVTQNPAMSRATNETLNAKRQILLARAIVLAAKIPNDVSPDIYFTLGWEKYTDGQFSESEGLLNNALIAHGNPDTANVWVRRALALLYFAPHSTLTNFEEGRRQFREALQYLDKRKDDWAVSNKGFMFQSWALAEKSNNQDEASARLFKSAQDEFEQITDPTQRQMNLVSLESAREISLISPSAAETLKNRLVGTWNMTFDNRQRGIMIILRDPTSGTLAAEFSDANQFGANQLEGSGEGPPVMIPYTGAVSLKDEHTASVTWSMKAGEGAQTLQQQGTDTLDIQKDGSILAERQIGKHTWKYILKK